MAGLLYSCICFILHSLCFLIPVAVLLHHFLLSACVSPSPMSVCKICKLRLLFASFQLGVGIEEQKELRFIRLTCLYFAALPCYHKRVTEGGRYWQVHLCVFSMWMFTPYAEQLMRELRIWANGVILQRWMRKVCSNKGVTNLALQCLKSPNERLLRTASKAISWSDF